MRGNPRNAYSQRGLVTIEVDKMDYNQLVVNLGANNPEDLFGEKAEAYAKKIAKRNGFVKLVDKESDARLYGQNNLVERNFYFIR